jgi:hypothetical protein
MERVIEMKKILRTTILALAGIVFAMGTIVAPMAAHANPVSKPEATVTVKSYDMDEYLDMLLETEQYDKYNTFANIANKDAWDKHVARQIAWDYEYPAYVSQHGNPKAVVIAKAARLGFDTDKDTFTLISLQNKQAKVKVNHGDQRFIVTLKPNYYGGWKIIAVKEIK